MNAPLNDAEWELLEMAAGLDIEELLTRAESKLGDNDDDNNMEGWVDEMDKLSVEEKEELHENIQLVQLVLVKVREHLKCRCAPNQS